MTMRRRFTMLALAATCVPMAIPSGDVFAQHAVADGRSVAATTTSGAATAAVSAAVLERPVTVSFDRVTVASAVKQLARMAGVRVQYQNDLFRPVDRAVSLRADNMPLGTAFARVLDGTDLRAVVLDEDLIAIKPTAAQVTGTIAGKVVDAKTGQVVPRATVALDEATKGVATGDDGAFRLFVPTGEHRLTVRAVGFVKQTQRATVTDGQTTMLSFSLTPSTSVLDEVVVTGTVVATERKAIPTPITVITAADIEKRGITRIDQLFRGEVPGVLALEQGMHQYSYMTPTGGNNMAGLAGSQVYSRGSSSLDGSANFIKTYIDGVELLDPSYLGTIDPKSIERVEIITGPQAATIYGSGALGGVMQIFTKKGAGRTSPDVTLSVKYGTLESSVSNGKTPTHSDALMLSGGVGPAFSYSTNLSYDYTGQWAPALFSRRYGASVGATHTNGPFTVSGSLSLTNGGNGTNDGVTNAGGTPYVQELVRNGEWNGGCSGGCNLNTILQTVQILSQTSSQTQSVNVDYQAGRYWQHHLTLGKSQNLFQLVPKAPQYRSPSDTLFTYQTNSGRRLSESYNVTVMPPLGDRFSTALTVGITGSQGDNTYYYGGASTTSATSLSNTGVRKLLDDESWGGFGSWRLGMFDRLYVTLGLRAERNNNYGRDYKIDWTPTQGITYTVEKGDLTVKLLGSYGLATRPPTPAQRNGQITSWGGYEPAQFYAQIESPLLKPEKERGPQGGVEIYYGNLGSLTINRYQQTVTDLISSIPVDSIALVYTGGSYTYWYKQTQSQNVAKVRKQGWESTASLTLGTLSLRGTYSWNDSRILDVGSATQSGYYAGQSFMRVPTHTGNLTVGYAHGGTSLTWVVNYVGSSPADANSLPVAVAWFGYSRIQTYGLRKTYVTGEHTKYGYVKSDLAASQRLTDWASATINVTNLGNSFAADASNSLSPSLGRQTLLGLSMRFPRTR